jgi:hypothetical protein
MKLAHILIFLIILSSIKPSFSGLLFMLNRENETVYFNDDGIKVTDLNDTQLKVFKFYKDVSVDYLGYRVYQIKLFKQKKKLKKSTYYCIKLYYMLARKSESITFYISRWYIIKAILNYKDKVDNESFKNLLELEDFAMSPTPYSTYNTPTEVINLEYDYYFNHSQSRFRIVFDNTAKLPQFLLNKIMFDKMEIDSDYTRCTFSHDQIEIIRIFKVTFSDKVGKIALIIEVVYLNDNMPDHDRTYVVAAKELSLGFMRIIDMMKELNNHGIVVVEEVLIDFEDLKKQRPFYSTLDK